MPDFDLTHVQNFLIALLLGALVGTEREKHRRDKRQSSFGGLRTYILLAQIGAISAWLSLHLQSPWLFVVTVVVVSMALMTAYVLENRNDPSRLGLTSEISAITVTLLGGAVMYGYAGLAVALGIITSAVLTFKQPLHGLVGKIATDDLYAALKLLIATFIVLPMLPNHPVDPWQALNPHRLWLLVILISSMSLVGYVAVRWLGAAHGAVITGLAGGLASSTAATLSFARSSKAEPEPAAATSQAVGILLAWLVMFIRVLVTVSIVYLPLLPSLLLPFGFMAGTTALIALRYFILSKSRYTETQQRRMEVRNPFSLLAAIKFGILFAAVMLIVKLVQLYASTQSLYLVAGLAGLTDVDAITLSMASYAEDVSNGLKLAAGAITIAALSNTIVKCGLVLMLGSGPLKKKLLKSTTVILLAGALAIWLL